MRVLLISPTDPDKPTRLTSLMGGENTYTQMLLRYPPKHVEFIYFETALKNHEIAYHPLFYVLLYLQKFCILPPGPRAYLFNLNYKYDLIYAHAHPVKIYGKQIPLVISDSSSNKVFLEKYLRLKNWQVYAWQAIKKNIFKSLGIIDGEINTKLASNFFVFSKWAKKIKHADLNIKDCEVLYPGLPVPKIKIKHQPKNIKLLFVGVWFERKGGRILLNVFRKLRTSFPNISLTILGQLPNQLIINRGEGITQQNYVTYEELKKQYRIHDVLVHIPPEIEGYGMTVAEAMSYGMCPVVSNICVLPELIENNKSGILIKPASERALETTLTKLLVNPKLIARLKQGARQRFITHFSIAVTNKKLLAVFEKATKVSNFSLSEK